MNKLKEKLIDHEGKVFAGILGTGAAALLIITATTAEDRYEIDFNKPVTVVDFKEEETTKTIDDFYIGATNMSREIAVEPFIEVQQCDITDNNICSSDSIPFPQQLVGAITVGDTIFLDSDN